MRDVYLDRVRYALGERKRSLQDTAAAGGTFSESSALAAAGFRFHHVADADTDALALAKAAVGGADDLGRVDAIVHATCLPASVARHDAGRFVQSGDVKHLMDFTASRLQADLELRDAAVFGLSQQACTGMLGSIRLARALIGADDGIERVLCVTSDRFPDGAKYEQAYNLISDGAASCLVSAEPGRFRVLASSHVTNGGLVNASDDETVGSYFSYMHRVVTEALRRAGVAPERVRWVVPQNTNDKAWSILTRLIGLTHAEVRFDSLPDAGHVISADNMVNLHHLIECGEVARGDVLLLAMAGYGMNWQCTVLEAM